MRLDQMAKRPGAALARSEASDAAPHLRDGQPARDPLAQLARLIARDETFAAIVRNNNRSEWRAEFPLRRDERPASARAREDIPSNQDWGGAEDSQSVASEAAEGPSGEPHDPYEYGDCDEPDYSNGLPDQRRWLRVSATIVGLALLGSASAFAYRAWFDGRVSIEEARAIDSSTAREKLMPSSQQADSRSDERLRAQSSVGAGGGTVSGEEKPADAQSAVPQALPSISVPSNGAPAQMAALTSGPAPPDSTAAPQNQPPSANDVAANPTTVSATEPSAGAGYKYIVQLSSQRSEAAAQATSRGLQTKYADLFGALQPFIRRSDLRDRGVYYRVLIGPFAAIGEANQLCGSLKKSGGDCVVQRN
jgi:cell division septation protein DedD